MSVLQGVGLPSWYPFRRLPGEADSTTLETLGRRRIDLLLAVTRGGGIDNPLLKEPFESVASFVALLITAAVSGDAIFKHWLLESEGDLLARLLQRASSSEKLAVLRDIFGDLRVGWGDIIRLTGERKEELIMELGYLLSDGPKGRRVVTRLYSDEGYVVAVRFWAAPKALSRNNGIPIKGWFVTTLDVLLAEAKSQYQKKIERTIRQHEEKKEELAVFAGMTESILKYWRSKRDVQSVKAATRFSKTGATVTARLGGRLYARSEFWPPCMRILLSRLQSTGYLQHGERLQLGLFLKKLGMPLEEQLQFWYKFAVDNVGMSWEEFERKGGYYIKHIYGVVGAGKDYEAPKCETIIAKYFCPFASMAFEELREALKHLYGLSERVLNKILREARLKGPRTACTMLLEEITGKKRNKEIAHPLQFVRALYYSKGRKVGGATTDAEKGSGGGNRPGEAQG